MWDCVAKLSQAAYEDPEYVTEMNRLANKYNIFADNLFAYPGNPEVCITL